MNASSTIERSSDFSLLIFNVVNHADWVLSSEPTLPSLHSLDTRAFSVLPGLMSLSVVKGFACIFVRMLACDFLLL